MKTMVSNIAFFFKKINTQLKFQGGVSFVYLNSFTICFPPVFAWFMTEFAVNARINVQE